MSVPFFMVIIEMFLYTGLVLFLVSSVFLIYHYYFSLNKKYYLSISFLWMTFNIICSISIFILIIFGFLNIFDPSYKNYSLDNAGTFAVIIKINVVVFVLSTIHFLLILLFSKYFAIYYKNGSYYCFNYQIVEKDVTKIENNNLWCVITFAKKKKFFNKTVVGKTLLKKFSVSFGK